MIRQNIRLGDLLIEKGIISEEELNKALEKQKELRERDEYKKLGEILIELGFATEKEILEALSRQLGYPFVDLYGEKIDYDLMSSFPLNLLEKHKILPYKKDNEYIYVATADPLDYEAIETIEKFSPKPLKIYIALSKDINTIIERLKITLSTNELIQKVKNEISQGGGENIAAIDELLDIIIKNAIKERSTDIHIEPGRYNFSVRGRIDGVLREIFSFDKDIYFPLVSKIKLLSNMDISEKRRPQDGRFTKNYDGHIYDFRVSTTPTLHGESVVLRVLDQQKILLRLTELGMSEYNLKRFEKLIHTPYGIVFVTGPTGSGKTTTLYAALNELKGVDKKIITVEDPVEYEIPLIQQIPVNYKIGVTFAVALRSILRQDPDIIMIGEVRDTDTLTASIQAALTGHLVLATLHTNDAPSAITRMVQMGAEPYLVADALIGVVAQRLVRKICPYCKDVYYPSKQELELIKPYLKENITFYKGKGCKECEFTGYLGREMISEVLVINDKLAHLIANNKDKVEILEVAKELGFVSMIEDGIHKIKAGITTIEEILRVVKVDVV
ncbi:general secretion pathway protein E [Lebetimonas natsushimae]|uniref:General secretion pathway protein E n=1 Tax=Lebetimonas natsushimae TaxID=1936991 RepID=A0A292YCV5_9BACT|nr:GspE/PulE family protein [Lebetimonas natsushimae]GAX87084.1 general secretion pathway protein E [Lebetimonas natsushimae]